MPIILIEGIDGSGKTTLANKLQQTMPAARVEHFGYPTTVEEADNYCEVYLKLLRSATENEIIIFDRCWMSDEVYGPIMRGRRERTDVEILTLEQTANNFGAIMIVCTVAPDEGWRRCNMRGETYIKDFTTYCKLSNSYTIQLELAKQRKLLPVFEYQT